MPLPAPTLGCGPACFPQEAGCLGDSSDEEGEEGLGSPRAPIISLRRLLLGMEGLVGDELAAWWSPAIFQGLEVRAAGLVVVGVPGLVAARTPLLVQCSPQRVAPASASGRLGAAPCAVGIVPRPEYC